ncbi:MAG: response regulator [SAR324 cluster bacterium]|nr:response regulator [SAR324 cluster bacterium]
MKILVVDDEIVSRKKMQKIMEEFGECIAVDSGKAAIMVYDESLKEGAPFNLITLDIVMPGMDGTEVLTIVRKLENSKKINKMLRAKILMVTSHSEKEVVVQCIKEGCDDYIVKPFNRDMVIKKLNQMGFQLDRNQGII